MTAADVITLVREQLNDVHEDYRFSDAELLRALDESQKELLYDRSTLRLSATGTMITVTDVTALTYTMLVGTEYRNALASSVCSKIYLKDSDDDANLKLSATHFQKYNSEI